MVLTGAALKLFGGGRISTETKNQRQARRNCDSTPSATAGSAQVPVAIVSTSAVGCYWKRRLAMICIASDEEFSCSIP